MEIQVAQNFVLNFLFNKLPRRRVNLFGEELELALSDKFQDHWYPDKPFKGSAYRCLRVTDPNDPVLNRAARESGNPVSDIIENLPADLAIWIDPGEVSYRIGEKGSVKILYSESDNFNAGGGAGGAGGGGLWNSNGAGSGSTGSPGISPGSASSLGTGSGHGLHTSSSTSSGASDDLNAEVAGYLPLDNLNTAMSALSVNCSNNQMPPPTPQQPIPQQQQQPQQQQSQSSQQAGQGGFSPFQPRPHHHQPVTYTAGTFAQTKFGSTKLKTNGKKTNRMSPTEFSNYIKQRALQKQNSVGSSGGGVNNGHFNPMRPPSVGASNGFRPMQQSGNNGFGGGSFHPGNNHHGGNNLNFGHQQGGRGGGGGGPNNSDPFFFPLFPDRSPGSNGMSGGGSMFNSNLSSPPSSSSNGAFQNALGGFGGSGSGGNNAQQPNRNPWSYADTDTEAFLQDILTVGLQQSTKQGGGNRNNVYGGGNNSSEFGSSSGSSSSSSNSDFGPGLASGLFADRFGSAASGLTLGGLGSGSLGGEGGDQSGVLRGGGIIGDHQSRGGSSGPSGAANGDKYQQQRVLVAN